MSHKEIEHLTEYLKNLTGLHLHSEYAPYYGGWRLVLIGDKGEHHGCFGKNGMFPRMKTKEFHTFLSGIIAGVIYQLKKIDLQSSISEGNRFDTTN